MLVYDLQVEMSTPPSDLYIPDPEPLSKVLGRPFVALRLET